MNEQSKRSNVDVYQKKKRKNLENPNGVARSVRVNPVKHRFSLLISFFLFSAVDNFEQSSRIAYICDDFDACPKANGSLTPFFHISMFYYYY